jgi:predicted DNA-binding protein
MAAHARLTIDMSPEEHKYLKMMSNLLGVSMREFVLNAVSKRIEELEDEKLAEKAYKTLRRIKTGETKTIPWKKRGKST